MTELPKFPNAFVTGSYAYGTPKPTSDIDLVVYLAEEEIENLAKMADKDFNTANNSYSEEDARSLRFGKLNLLCVTSKLHFAVWRQGTEEMKKLAPVTRDYAITHLRLLRQKHGLRF